jgi:Txe/YoeB family toxin of Txe-Axe toxin-antitoxin module
MNNKPIYVTFIDKKLESEFESLKEGKFEDKRLYKFMDRAIKDLKKDPSSGTKIPKKLWPKIYIKSYGVNNLWKYDLPNGWRIIYTIKTDEVTILNVILEWFDHKEYERRFKY